MKRLAAAPEEASIVDLTHEGRGVARLDGKAVFVADALPGERVVLRRLRRHRKFDEAVLETVLEASPDRVAAPCPHFGSCGGCSLQHLAPAAQLAFKQSQLLENLARLGGVEPATVLEPLGGPVWNYRRRARLGIKFVARKGRVLVGFRERAAPFVADLHECRILAPPLDRLMDPLAALVGSLDIAARVPQAELAAGDGACAVVLRVLDAPLPSDLAKLRAFECEQGVRVYLQSGGPGTVTALTSGLPPLSYRLAASAITIEFEPTDFIQVNGALNEQLVARALAQLDPGPGEHVLDLFCGLGNFSLPLARRAGQVTGVEGDAALVVRAAENARRAALGNVEFVAADLATIADDAPWTSRSYARVLLDPPRAGAREVLPVVGRCGAGRVVYISCHPGSLARDAGILVREHGFRLSAAGVMDMFPHTNHVEAMAVFER